MLDVLDPRDSGRLLGFHERLAGGLGGLGIPVCLGLTDGDREAAMFAARRDCGCIFGLPVVSWGN
jgi:hypothetical protein